MVLCNQIFTWLMQISENYYIRILLIQIGKKLYYNAVDTDKKNYYIRILGIVDVH